MAHVEDAIHHVNDSPKTNHPKDSGNAVKQLRRARLALSGGLTAAALTGVVVPLVGLGMRSEIAVIAAVVGTAITAVAVYFATRPHS